MALVGRLEDLGLAELFHLLSLFKKSGELTLRNGSQSGTFVFNKGKIVHAADATPRETLGSILVNRNMISESMLQAALELQQHQSSWKRLGAILVEMQAISIEVLERVIREQMQEITEKFLRWQTGFFSFKPSHTGNTEPGSRTAADMELSGGLNTDQFILEILTKLDEVSVIAGNTDALLSESEEAGGDQSATRASGPQLDIQNMVDYLLDPTTYQKAGATGGMSNDAAKEMADLRSLMVEIQLRSTSFTGEITLMILRYATRVVHRGVLCHVSDEGIRGIGQFGVDASLPKKVSADDRVRNMLIPAHEPSVFFEVLENIHTYRGGLKPCKWNTYLIRQLGGREPQEIIAIPIIVDGMIIGIFYGDNVPHHNPVGSIHGLELLMIEAGLAIEKKLLQVKLKQVEEQVRILSQGLHDSGT
ncbi:MAG: DUF4388 domain-containing protein [bacterium]|nr:DUF4388 domain-containing protein [bacterium]